VPSRMLLGWSVALGWWKIFGNFLSCLMCVGVFYLPYFKSAFSWRNVLLGYDWIFPTYQYINSDFKKDQKNFPISNHFALLVNMTLEVQYVKSRHAQTYFMNRKDRLKSTNVKKIEEMWKRLKKCKKDWRKNRFALKEKHFSAVKKTIFRFVVIYQTKYRKEAKKGKEK
jgi:hypothetical protein